MKWLISIDNAIRGQPLKMEQNLFRSSFVCFSHCLNSNLLNYNWVRMNSQNKIKILSNHFSNRENFSCCLSFISKFGGLLQWLSQLALFQLRVWWKRSWNSKISLNDQNMWVRNSLISSLDLFHFKGCYKHNNLEGLYVICELSLTRNLVMMVGWYQDYGNG